MMLFDLMRLGIFFALGRMLLLGCLRALLVLLLGHAVVVRPVVGDVGGLGSRVPRVGVVPPCRGVAGTELERALHRNEGRRGHGVGRFGLELGLGRGNVGLGIDCLLAQQSLLLGEYLLFNRDEFVDGVGVGRDDCRRGDGQRHGKCCELHV